MKIGRYIFIVMTLFALIGSIFGTSYHYVQNNKVMEAEVFEHLETAAQSRAAHINGFLDKEIEKLEIFSEGVAFINFMKSDDRGDANSDVFVNVKNRIDSRHRGIALFDTEGILLVSENNLPGADYSGLDFFKNGGDELYVLPYYDSTRNNSYVGIIMPMRDAENGAIIGAIGMDIVLDDLNEITSDRTGLGDTGELYLINKESYAISDLLFVENAFLEWKVDSIGSRDCLEDLEEYHFGDEMQEHEETIFLYLDYTGEEVIGTHAYIPKAGWCLLAEINRDEILGSQEAIFQRVSITIVIGITLFMSIFGLIFGRFIDRRVVLKKSKRRL